jgi:hypothetical protein
MSVKLKISRKKVNRYIFIDLDNTLSQTQVCVKTRPRKGGKILKCYVERHGINMRLDVVLRPGALELLKALRKKHVVYLFSAASPTYVKEHNKLLGLGFREDQMIWAGQYIDEITGQALPHNLPPIERVVLIDNYSDLVPACAEKMRFLRTVGQPKLHVVRYFDGGLNQGFTPEEIKRIVHMADTV